MEVELLEVHAHVASPLCHGGISYGLVLSEALPVFSQKS